jgi:hypothetical protein
VESAANAISGLAAVLEVVLAMEIYVGRAREARWHTAVSSGEDY